MRLRAPLRGNKGGSRRARPAHPPPPASPLGAPQPGQEYRPKKRYFFFFFFLSANAVFESVHSPPFALLRFLLPRGAQKLLGAAAAPCPRSPGSAGATEAGTGSSPGALGDASPCCNAALRGETPSRLCEFLVWEQWRKKKKKKQQTPHFSCIYKKKIVWRNRKPGGAAGSRGGRKRRAFEWVVSPQCSSGREFSLQGTGHEKDPERATKSLLIFCPLFFFSLKHNRLPDNQRFGGIC